jgi:large subunit ribosomal protein L19e
VTDLSAQKRLAADVLDVGENRVWFDPESQGDIAEAITREEIRELVQSGTIQAEDAKGNSRGRARERDEKRSYGHQKGPGKRRGTAGGRQNEREDWQASIRAQREFLREQRDAGELTPAQYRDAYGQASGGEFDSVRDLRNYLAREYGGDV